MAVVAELAEFGITDELLRARGLRHYAEAGSLVLAETGADGREHRLTPAAAAAWQALKAEAGTAGVQLFIVSAFRSVARQCEIVRRKLEAGQELEAILQVCAPPGYSEHHTGRAADVGTPGVPLLELEFAASRAFEWLEDNAHRFGYRLSYPPGNRYGYAYEPWHWCYRSSE